MLTNELKNLLTQVTTLNQHYKTINALTGDNFNLFRILKLEASEVKLHSAFLAALLDPNGDHGQKDLFLKLFAKAFCFKDNDFDTSRCTIEIEKHTGFLSLDSQMGGRLDLVITDTAGRRIIIENKIFAGDQTNQLQRYYNYSPDADLIYLTLNGNLPSDKSCGELVNNKHYKCLSYKSDILAWLEECRKEVAVLPMVRESITQYINLIKYLTNQTLNQTMQKELNQIIKTHLESSFIVANSLNKATNELSKEFFDSIKEICEELGVKCYNKVNLNENYSGFWISREEWQHVSIGFQFQKYDKDLIYGFATKQNPEKFSIPIELRTELGKIAGKATKPNGWWPWYNKLEEPYNDWSKYQAWNAILSGNMRMIMKEKIEYLLANSGHLEL